MKCGDTELLERDEPRAQLEEALKEARSGRGRVVTVEGEAGIGKTSLVLSFAEANRRDVRVYMGGCEPLATPEPLGPLRDVARDSHGGFSVSTNSLLATFEALLHMLINGRGPGFLLVEDIHWADDSTLDLLRYLGRRIRSAPILIVVTFRNDEARSQSSLAALWADMPRDCCARIELYPLSVNAVTVLSTRSGRAGQEVFDATGGNPFYVTEVLSAERSTVPPNVRDATLARMSRLSSIARRALECASVFPRQIEQGILRQLAQDASHAAVEECLRGGMLVAAGGSLTFRHELARRAVHDAISPLRRRELHAAILKLLKARPIESAAEVAHHAQHAGAAQDLVIYSLRAAADAAALGAHRESVDHLARALERGSWFSNAERAELLERQADTGERCGAFLMAVTAIEEAMAARKRAGDIVGLGNALRISARLQWQHGQAELAELQSLEALEVLKEHGGTWQYAMALSGQSQLDMLAHRIELALARALEAMALAEQLGRSDIYLHALTNATVARCSEDVEAGEPHILAALAEARRRGEPDLLPRLYLNLAYMLTSDRRYKGLFGYLVEGISAAVARDNSPLEAYMRGTRAIALLDLGRIQEAIAEAEFVLCGPYPHGTVRFNAQIAVARARIRLGVPEDGVLDDVRSLPTSQRDIMRQAPLAVVDAEALWLGLPRPGALERLQAAFDTALGNQGQRWNIAETGMWLKTLGQPVQLPSEVRARLRPAHRAHIAGEWREAARAWEAIGCAYEQGIALSMGDEPAQREALGLFDGLGAAAAAARLRRQMRARGVRAIPRGPMGKTRAHPAGLTGRQAQVLGLIVEGLGNADIAARLFISPKTTEHHVSAIMARLGAGTRLEAAAVARARNLVAERKN